MAISNSVVGPILDFGKICINLQRLCRIAVVLVLLFNGRLINYTIIVKK